jgi:hypothetical protein
MKTPYAGYDVLAKWRTPSFDEKTREVVRRRMDAPPRRFFTPEELRLLEAIVARLLPQSDRSEPIPLALLIDDYLAQRRGEGYRNEHMPFEWEAWRIGLTGIDAEARRRFGGPFIEISGDHQDEVLRRVQAGDVGAPDWGGMDAARFFKDGLLRVTAGLYYAHPDAWSEIGFGGPANPRGYVRTGFNERDPWEARATR